MFSSLSVFCFLLKKEMFFNCDFKKHLFQYEIYTQEELQKMAFTQSLSVSYIPKIVEEKSCVSFFIWSGIPIGWSLTNLNIFPQSDKKKYFEKSKIEDDAYSDKTCSEFDLSHCAFDVKWHMAQHMAKQLLHISSVTVVCVGITNSSQYHIAQSHCKAFDVD